MNFEFLCPHCAEHLDGSTDLAGLNVACPSCGGEFIVPAPPSSSSAADEQPVKQPVNKQVNHWIVDARILLVRAPPGYVQMLVEVPKGWNLPRDGTLPQPAFDAVTKTIRTRFPQCPVTPVEVRVADQEALKRISGRTDYCNESCKAWFLGKAPSRT